MRGRPCSQPFLVERGTCRPNAVLLPPRWANRSPPHPPQCAHWGTFPPRGRLWRSRVVEGLLRAPCLSPNLETFFRENAFQHSFPGKCVPNRGWYAGSNSPATGPDIANAKSSEWERAAIKTRGPGGAAPGALSSGFLRRKPGSRPEPGGKPRCRSGPAMVPTQPPCQRQPGAACPLSGCLGSHPRGAAPRGPRLPGGGPHFSREMGRKRAGALCHR